MELTSRQTILVTGKPQYALPEAGVTLTSATVERPLGSFAVNVNSSPAKSWRMVYDKNKIHALFESQGFTHTIRSLFVAGTEADCIAKAKALGLAIPDDPMRPPK